MLQVSTEPINWSPLVFPLVVGKLILQTFFLKIKNKKKIKKIKKKKEEILGKPRWKINQQW